MSTKASWTRAKSWRQVSQIESQNDDILWGDLSIVRSRFALYTFVHWIYGVALFGVFFTLLAVFFRINALIPLLRKYWRQGFPVYALSSTTSFCRVRKPEEVGIKMLSMTLDNCVASCQFPPVSTALNGFPMRSQTKWILQVNPPGERPNACSPAFFCVRSRLRSFHCGRINFPQIPID